MLRPVATLTLRLAVAAALVACSTPNEKRQSTSNANGAVRSPGVDTGGSQTPTGDLPVALPITDHTSVGIRVDSVTIWLDSTRIGNAAQALGATLPLGKYFPGGDLIVACFHSNASTGGAYILLKAGYSDTARVVQTLIAREADETKPRLRCRELTNSATRISNSLGLKLGMTRADVERALGAPGQSHLGPIIQSAKYVMAVTSQDTVHGKLTADLLFERDTLVAIRMRRGEEVPRVLE